jgi:hypothetical protein
MKSPTTSFPGFGSWGLLIPNISKCLRLEGWKAWRPKGLKAGRPGGLKAVGLEAGRLAG